MIIKNLIGASYYLNPIDAELVKSLNINGTYKGNVLLIDGDITEQDIPNLYEYDSYDEFIEKNYDKIIGQFENLDFNLEYNFSNDKIENANKIKIQKVPNAIPFIYKKDGHIGLALIALLNTENRMSYPNYKIKYQIENEDGSLTDIEKNVDVKFFDTEIKFDLTDIEIDKVKDKKIRVDIELPSTQYVETMKIRYLTNLSDVKMYSTIDEINFKLIKNFISNVEIEIKDRVKKFIFEATLNDDSYLIFDSIVLKLFNNLIFTNSIGTWEDEEVIVTLKNINGTQGSENILKDVTIILKDLLEVEKGSIPKVDYDEDFNPGVIIIDPVSEDGFISNIEKTKPLTITGKTIDIEDGQKVIVNLGDIKEAEGEVQDNTWSVTFDDISDLENGKDYILEVSVTDANGNISKAFSIVRTQDTNKAPVIEADDEFEIDEDTSKVIQVKIYDPENQGLKSISASAENGEVKFNDDFTQLTYTPNKDFNGEDKIVIEAEDVLGAKSQKEILVKVNQVNDKPVLNGVKDNYSVNVGEQLIIPYEITDVDGDEVTINVTANVGSVSVNEDNNQIIYTAPQTSGQDTIKIVLDDGTSTSSKDITIDIVEAEQGE